jgi:proline iminopeptidase
MGGDALQPFLRMIYLDQRGSGASENAVNYHLERMTQDIEEVRKSLGTGRVCLIAHSFGGIIATEYAHRYPQNVSSLIMLNAVVHYHSPYNTRMRIAFADRLTGVRSVIPQTPSETQLKEIEGQALERLAKQGLGYRLLSENPEVQARMQEVDGSYPRTLDFGKTVIKEMRDYAEYYRDYSPVTAKITIPVLVLTGDHDYAVGPEQYKTFRFPNQTVRHVDGGHLMYYERASEIAGYICDFLATHRVVEERERCGPSH